MTMSPIPDHRITRIFFSICFAGSLNVCYCNMGFRFGCQKKFSEIFFLTFSCSCQTFIETYLNHFEGFSKFGKEDTMAISKELLDILACPKCKGDIHLNEFGDGLICEACKLLYEIRDDIPIMLIDEARPIRQTAG